MNKVKMQTTIWTKIFVKKQSRTTILNIKRSFKFIKQKREQQKNGQMM